MIHNFVSGVIDGKTVEVVEPSVLFNNRSLYPENYTALDRGDEYIYPLRCKTDCRPGAYPSGGMIIFRPPISEEEQQVYSRGNVIDFSNKENVAEIIKAQEALHDKERTILTTADNIFKPPIDPKDQPEMIGIKTAVSRKNCDIDKYEPRFNGNFNNEKRLFNAHSMTLLKIKRITEALDIKVTMTFEDASPDVPNPMGLPITVQITSNGGTIQNGGNT